MRLEIRSARFVASLALLTACSPSPAGHNLVGSGSGSGGISGSGSGGISGGGSGGTSGTGPVINVGGIGGIGGTGTGGGRITELPSDFTKADLGGWKLGEPITADPGAGGSGGTGGGTSGCGTLILAVVRDMQTSHPDFEDYVSGEVQGIVETTLGPDRKPVYARDGETDGETDGSTSAANFDPWYRTTDGVNMPYKIEFFLAPTAGGVSTFLSNAFFPLDGAGYGNENLDHNYHFTTEIHTQFRYNGGETFRFIGDDDLWVFINNQLAIDLGGVHGAEDDEVILDDAAAMLGIQVGQVYPLDLFHAERHTSESNFRIDTSLEFVDCGTIVQ